MQDPSWSSWQWLSPLLREESARRHGPVSVRLTNCCFRLTVRGNECLRWQWWTREKGRAIVWIAEDEAAQFQGVDRALRVLQGGGGGRNAYAGLCFQKAVIMSFTPNVWLSCRSLTHFIRCSFSLGVVCGPTVPVDGRGILGMWFPALETDGKGNRVIQW